MDQTAVKSKQGSGYCITDPVSEQDGTAKEQEEVESGSAGCQQSTDWGVCSEVWVESPEALQIIEVGDGKKMHWRRVSVGFWQLPTLNQAPASSTELNKPDIQSKLFDKLDLAE